MSTQPPLPDISQMQDRIGDATGFLKKMSHPDRLMICCLLVEHELSVSQIETLLELRQPALSQQLGELREAGLIVGRKEGKQMFYRLSDSRVAKFVTMMHAIFCASAEKEAK